MLWGLLKAKLDRERLGNSAPAAAASKRAHLVVDMTKPGSLPACVPGCLRRTKQVEPLDLECRLLTPCWVGTPAVSMTPAGASSYFSSVAFPACKVGLGLTGQVPFAQASPVAAEPSGTAIR